MNSEKCSFESCNPTIFFPIILKTDTYRILKNVTLALKIVIGYNFIGGRKQHGNKNYMNIFLALMCKI